MNTKGLEEDMEREAVRARSEAALLERLLQEIRTTHREETRAAVAEGIVEAGKQLLTPENAEAFWGALFIVAKRRAQVKAGGWLLGGIGRAGSAALWAMVLVVAMYATLGWNGMVGVWKAVVHARSGQ